MWELIFYMKELFFTENQKNILQILTYGTKKWYMVHLITRKYYQAHKKTFSRLPKQRLSKRCKAKWEKMGKFFTLSFAWSLQPCEMCNVLGLEVLCHQFEI